MHASGTIRVILLVGLLSAAPSGADDLAPLWNHNYGDNNWQYVKAMAVDNVGNSIITGSFEGNISFGGAYLSSSDETDVFIAKLGPDGSHIWSRRFGGVGRDTGVDVAVDNAGSIYLTGYFEGSINLGGSTFNSGGSYDTFLAKFYSNGNHVWSHGYGGAESQAPGAIASAGDNHIYVVGSFRGALNLGPGTMTSAGGTDIFYAQFDDGNGVCLRSLRFGDADDQNAWAVSVNTVGEVVFTGGLKGSADFGGGSLTSAGDFDVFIAKYNMHGQHIWSERFGDADTQYGVDVDYYSPARSWVIAGIFRSTINLGGGTFTSSGGTDSFVARFDHNSNHLWSRHLSGPQSLYVRGLDIGPYGNIGVAGYFMDTANFGGAPLTSAGDWDVFMAVYNWSNVHQSSQSFGDAERQYPEDIKFDAGDDVRLTGDFEGSIDFGLGSIYSSGYTDIFLARFGEALSTVAEGVTAWQPELRVYPNPAASATSLAYTLPYPAWAKLKLYDAAGRHLANLVDHFASAGEHICGLPPAARSAGLCYARLEVNGETIVQKVVTLE